MNNQEAIRLIRNLPTMCEFVDAYGEPVDSDAYYEAVDIAISALQAQEKCEDAVHTITSASFTGNDGLDYVETLVALNALKMVKKPCDDANFGVTELSR